MKVLLFSLLLLGLVQIYAPVAHSQSPAFDSEVYFPSVDNPDEIQVRKGGIVVTGVGVDDKGYNRILLYNLPGHRNNTTIIWTGPDFNLKMLRPKSEQFVFENAIIGFGHLHNKNLKDIITSDGEHTRIYWSDEQGNYDSSRRTILLKNKNGDYGSQFGAMAPMVVHYDGDSLDAIVIGTTALYHDKAKDSSFLELFLGGNKLFQSYYAISDSQVFFSQDKVGLSVFQSDLRGTGRKDAILFDNTGDWTYFKNEPPFSLEKLKLSMQDTLLTARENKDYTYDFIGNPAQMFSMPAFSKESWDQSQDLFIYQPVDKPFDGTKQRICIFKGGSNFGSQRITLDTPDFVIHHPAYYDPSFTNVDWLGMHNCGDMTGTGNLVYHLSGADDEYGYEFFYVLGKAMDDKVDITYLTDFYYCMGMDTLTANPDNMEDILVGEGERNTDLNGQLFLIPGTKKIPVRLNPLYAVKPSVSVSQEALSVYPNPIKNSAVLTFNTPRAEEGIIHVRNILGQEVYHEEHRTIGGAESVRMQLPHLPSGSY